MRKIAIMIFVALLPWAADAQEGFKIVGKLGGTLGGDLVLAGNTPAGLVKLAEAKMENGNFLFIGRVDSLMPAYILTAEQQSVATLMLENQEYTVVAGENGIEVEGGGEAQRILSQFDLINQQILRENMKAEQELKAAYAEQNSMKLQALQQQYQKKLVELAKAQDVLMTTFKDSPVTAYVIANGMGQMDYVSLQEVYDRLGEPAKNSVYGELIVRQLDFLKQVEVGSVAPDFKAANLAGDTLSLHGAKGKLKLVDFWASWCGPCRAEMPNLRKLYKKYHGKGLEIFAVSLDDKRANWEQASRDEQIKWLNVSDLSGWRSPIAARYLVRAIPATFLLDGENRIIAKDLRGKELEKKVMEVLGK